ncbi:ATP phosphoribosyltransferase regulatory subunit [Hyphomonas jannaschiana]|uniref:tRNA synthetase class II core domain-containing protein n=1 Tax=Hyphomonas jannaschiana VP2 TaxID=1280952 RepID=A0A059FKI7_9PROT|nr:ATP phosphoribosyltransferase regulatory subunit [Hyphomonas jannaschiana]KCZ91185.1 tRNA synthetase class II core domain-containing protein [Hyphomonas jannaschiana VP2]
MTYAAVVKAARSRFEASGAEPVNPAYILPSDIPLELSGEAVRARLCVFTDHRGNEMVMRPDLTLPVAGLEAERLASGTNGPKAYCYAAEAFRLPAADGDPMEFTQVGFERFGRESDPTEDAEAFALVHEAVRDCGVVPVAIATGDLAIFPAFIDALGLPRVTADLLKRAFRQEGGVRALVEASPAPIEADLVPTLEAATPEEAETAFRAALAERGIPLIGTRSVPEIIAGLRARAAALAAGGVPDKVREVIGALAAVNCTAAEAADQLDAIAVKYSLPRTSSAIDRVARRMELIRELLPEVKAICRFRSGFGRRFTYYDGFLFETLGANLAESRPIASGGRYDGLVSGLSNGKANATAIGGVVRPDRVLRAKGRGA